MSAPAAKSTSRAARRSDRSSRPAPAAAAHLPTSLLRAAVLILALTIITYLPALRVGFIWDDDTHLTANLVTQPGGIWKSWFTTEQPNYWPVTWSLFWAQWEVFGTNPLGYHVVNVLLHGLNAVLLWRVLTALSIPGAWLATLLFVVHPVNVETAAWITQLKTLLAMGCYLGSLLCYLRFRNGPGETRWYAGSITLFLLGMLSKPSIVTLPFVLLLMEAWQKRRITQQDILRSLPYFTIAGVLSLTEIWFQYTRSIAETIVREDNFLSRLAGAGWVVWFYLSKILVPVDLMFVYPRWAISPGKALHWLPLIGLLAAAAACWRQRRTWGRPAGFALAYFVITLLPVLGFLNIFYMRYSFVADHWQYQSVPGILAMVAAAGTRLFETRWASRKSVGTALGATLIALLAASAWAHQRTYWSIETLWKTTLEKNPGAWIAHQCLGEHYSRQGRPDLAIQHFTAELKIKPDFAEPHYNIGIALASQGRVDEALQSYRRAVELDPKYAEAYNNAGVLLAGMGRPDVAIRQYEQALAARPKFAEAYVNWGLALASQKRYDEAGSKYAEALKLQPDHIAAHTNWGATLLAQGKAEEAISHLQKAAELDPASPEAHLNLGRALAAAGRLPEAIERGQLAIRLNPQYQKAHQSVQAWSARLRSPGAGQP